MFLLLKGKEVKDLVSFIIIWNIGLSSAVDTYYLSENFAFDARKSFSIMLIGKCS